MLADAGGQHTEGSIPCIAHSWFVERELVRAGGGYRAGPVAAGVQSPQEDGLWIMDTFSGEATLLVSLARLLAAVRSWLAFRGDPFGGSR